ncbi:hypothetical protein [Microtetraspora malaysiensis]
MTAARARNGSRQSAGQAARAMTAMMIRRVGADVLVCGRSVAR